MTSLQSQYLLCPPLACNTAQTHLGIDSINRRIRSCGILPILAQEPAAVLAEFAALVDDCTRVDPNLPTNVLLGSNMVIQTTREHSYVLVGQNVNSNTSCVRPSVVVLKNVPTDVHCGQYMQCQNLISVSSCAKVVGDVHQLSFSGVGYGTSHLHTSSAKIVYLKDAVPCQPFIPAFVDTYTVISCLQHES